MSAFHEASNIGFACIGFSRTGTGFCADSFGSSKENISLRTETVDAPSFSPDASIPVILYVIAHNVCCPHSRISQGRECVQGKPSSGFPCAFSHPPAGDRFRAAKPHQHEKRHASACLFSCWYARLDSNQRPLESELSGRQAGKPCGARAWLVLHKFPSFWRKTSEALSDRASEIFRGSSQIVVCAPYRSCDSVHLCDLIDELFHVLDIGVRCVLRIDLR